MSYFIFRLLGGRSDPSGSHRNAASEKVVKAASINERVLRIRSKVAESIRQSFSRFSSTRQMLPRV
ncbi:hypothetical protein RE6C_00292 [Rhodopirellula europaea 6C]|uniref:Uncharacterized protein n=1 Tax=Rhodopirellula europaea 6C TaxID=1263867 RepID=M2B232_9BACT|nr:hypothetical protein RE6C_00292 [Rhodopirellula europaea 6C]